MNDYKAGDVVILTDERPEHWNPSGHMDKYLGQIITIKWVRDSLFSFGDNEWAFRISDISSYATEESILATKKEKAAKAKVLKEKLKYLVYKGRDVLTLAIDIFGEERVDYEQHSKTSFDIIIKFPEINIENSRGEKHTVKNLLFKFHITINSARLEQEEGYKASIQITGCRLSVSLKEFESNYRWSHLRTGKAGWADFCLGSSDFRIMIENVQTELTEDSWIGMFLGVEPYLKWESLEGGPHIKMQNIAYANTLDSSKLQKELASIISGIPRSCWEYINGPKINTYHPDVFDYMNINSSIRQLSTYSKKDKEEKIKQENDYYKSRDGIEWKGEKLHYQIIEDDRQFDNGLKKEVIEKYSNIINKEGVNFSKKYQYAKRKQHYKSKVFGEI